LTDIFLIVNYNFRTAFLFYGVVFTMLILAIFISCRHCHIRARSRDLNPFISLVGLGLGVYIVILIENLLQPFFFTIHYYVWGVATVLCLTFLYHVTKLLR